jgi:hypothetical protein
MVLVILDVEKIVKIEEFDAPPQPKTAPPITDLCRYEWLRKLATTFVESEQGFACREALSLHGCAVVAATVGEALQRPPEK